MFVLLVSRGVPTQRDPQWGCFERDQAEALVALGHKVVVISVDGRFRLYYRKIGRTMTIINGIKYYNSYLLPFKILSLLVGRRLAYGIQKRQLNGLYKKIVEKYGKPDVIFSHYLSNSYLALTLKQKYNIPIVAMEHWSVLAYDMLPTKAVELGKKTYIAVDAVIAVSSMLKRKLHQHFGVDALVVPNVIGPEFIYGNFHKHNDRNTVKFISVGTLINIKAYDILVRAFHAAQLPKNSWQLNIIGAGQEMDNILNLIDEFKLIDNIHLLGRKTKQEIVEYLRDSDIFVLSSKSETFGVVYIEAMSQGLPVIATACGGPDDIINKSNGILVPVDDVQALAIALRQMFDGYNAYDKHAIAQYCHERFSPEIVGKQVEKILRSVCK